MWVYFIIPNKNYCSFTLSLPISSGDKKIQLGEKNCSIYPIQESTTSQVIKIQKILEAQPDLDAETKTNLRIYQHILETAKIY